MKGRGNLLVPASPSHLRDIENRPSEDREQQLRSRVTAASTEESSAPTGPCLEAAAFRGAAVFSGRRTSSCTQSLMRSPRLPLARPLLTMISSLNGPD